MPNCLGQEHLLENPYPAGFPCGSPRGRLFLGGASHGAIWAHATFGLTDPKTARGSYTALLLRALKAEHSGPECQRKATFVHMPCIGLPLAALAVKIESDIMSVC